MKGVRVDVHQSSRRSDNRKLLSITSSPSVAVVDEMAPRWITASSLRPLSQSVRPDGGTKSASWRFCRLRHLPSDPSVSLTTTSVRPASLRSATTFDPINPAPPVTNNMKRSFSDSPNLILKRSHSSRGRLEGWPRARSRLWPSFETRASFDKLRSALRTRLMDGIDVILNFGNAVLVTA